MSELNSPGLQQLLEVVNALLTPGTGCPWDLEQTHDSLKKYLVEESYELIEAIDAKDDDAMQEELGDVLLQPLMHARMAEKEGRFNIDQVAGKQAEKLIRRHPHVFGDTEVADSDEVLRNWDKIKKSEKPEHKKSILEGVPKALPSLTRAHTISKRAARCGFEWPDLDGVFAKLDEENVELKAAIKSQDKAAIESELGDLLFTIVNVARWLDIDAEDALRKMLNRFTARFQYMESAASAPLGELTADEWDVLWNEAKRNSCSS